MFFYFFELIRSPSSAELAATFSCSLTRRNRRRRRRGGERLRGCSDIKRCLFFFLAKQTKTFFRFLTLEHVSLSFFSFHSAAVAVRETTPERSCSVVLPSAAAAAAAAAACAAEAEAEAEAEAGASSFPFFSFSASLASASAATTPQGSSTAGTGSSLRIPTALAATCTGTASGPVPPRTLGSEAASTAAAAAAAAQSPPALTNLTLPLEEGEMRGRSSWTMAAKAEGAPKMKVVRERSG